MKRTLIMAAIGATTIFCAQNAAAEDLVVKTGSGSTKFALADVTSLKFRRNRQTLWGGCTDANPKLLLNDT